MIENTQETLAEAARAMNTGCAEPEVRIGFATSEVLWEPLTAKRWEIRKGLCGVGPVSIREAARRVGRDLKAAHRDIAALLKAGLPTRVADGRIEFPFDAVKVEFLLRAA